MLIDNKGKLFGKLNILDLLIILVVVLILVFGGMYFAGRGEVYENKATVKYTVEVTGKDAEYISHVIVGEDVVDGVTKQPMGKIVDFYQNDALAIGADLVNAEFKTTTIPEKYDVYITMELDADIVYPDILSGSEEIKIGKGVALRSESVAMHGYIVDIDYDIDEIRGRK